MIPNECHGDEDELDFIENELSESQFETDEDFYNNLVGYKLPE